MDCVRLAVCRCSGSLSSEGREQSTRLIVFVALILEGGKEAQVAQDLLGVFVLRVDGSWPGGCGHMQYQSGTWMVPESLLIPCGGCVQDDFKGRSASQRPCWVKEEHAGC